MTWSHLKPSNCSVSSTDLEIDEVANSYYPVIYVNDFWLLRDKFVVINGTVKELLLSMEIGPISLTRWQLYLQIDQSFQTHRSYGSMMEGEADELKVLSLQKVCLHWVQIAVLFLLWVGSISENLHTLDVVVNGREFFWRGIQSFWQWPCVFRCFIQFLICWPSKTVRQMVAFIFVEHLCWIGKMLADIFLALVEGAMYQTISGTAIASEVERNCNLFPSE